MILCDVEEMSYQEMAEIIENTLVQVMSRSVSGEKIDARLLAECEELPNDCDWVPKLNLYVDGELLQQVRKWRCASRHVLPAAGALEPL